MRAQGYSVLVVSPDPLYAERLLTPDGGRADVAQAERLARVERAVLINGLRRAGVQVIHWRVDEPLAGILEQAGYGLLAASRRAHGVGDDDGDPLAARGVGRGVGCADCGLRLRGQRVALIAAVVLGVLGWVGALRRWSWSTHVVFVGQVGLVGAAAWMGAPLGWLLPALLGALAVWDLDLFRSPGDATQGAADRRTAGSDPAPASDRARRATLIGGGAFAGLGLLARAPLGFGVTLALALALAIVLGWAARRLAA